MSEKKYAIQSAAFGEGIYLGRINRAGTAFADKEMATDDVLLAVAEFVRSNYAGSMSVTFTAADREAINLTVKATTAPTNQPETEHEEQA